MTENSAEDKTVDGDEETAVPSDQPLPEDVVAALANAVIEGCASGDDLRLFVQAEAIATVAEYLRDREAGHYDYVANLCGVDYGDELGVVYHFGRHGDGAVAVVHVRVPRDDPRLPSLVEIHPAANWNEREAMEMYGIVFQGHPDPRKLLLPDDWEGFPMRKDYEIPDHPYLRPDPLHELG